MQQTVATTMLSFSCCFVNCRASFYVISRWRFARDCWNLSLLLGVNVQLAQHHQGKGKGKGNGEREGRSAAREKGERARSSLRLSGRQVDWARSARGGGGQVARVKCQNSFRWWCKTENEMRPPCKKRQSWSWSCSRNHNFRLERQEARSAPCPQCTAIASN